MKHALAVREHRGAPLLEIELTRIDLREVGNQLCLYHVASPHELANAVEQLALGSPASIPDMM
jgi:hypothetical protein